MTMKNSIVRILRLVTHSDAYSHLLYIDHRPFKYLVRDLEEFALKGGLAFKAMAHKNKIKISDRYIVHVRADSIEKSVRGLEVQGFVANDYITLTTRERSFLQSRVREPKQ